MTNKKLLGIGVVGSTLFAVCCFTPVLVVLFGIAGLSAWMGGWLDYYVLFPGLALFLLLTGYALYRMRRGPKAGCGRDAADTAPGGAT